MTSTGSEQGEGDDHDVVVGGGPAGCSAGVFRAHDFDAPGVME